MKPNNFADLDDLDEWQLQLLFSSSSSSSSMKVP